MTGVHRVVVAAGLAVGLAVVVGCSDSAAGKMEVSGSVKFGGKALPDGGVVMFEPLEKQGTEAMALVTGGTYLIPKANGLKPGKYRVRLTAGDGKTAVNPANPDEPPGPGKAGGNIVSKDIIPADWGVSSKQEVTVKGDGPNKFDFDIP